MRPPATQYYPDYPELEVLRYRYGRLAEDSSLSGIQMLRNAIGVSLGAIIRREGGLDGPAAPGVLNSALVDAACAVRRATEERIDGFVAAFLELHDRIEIFFRPARRRFWSELAADVARYPRVRRDAEQANSVRESKLSNPLRCGP